MRQPLLLPIDPETSGAIFDPSRRYRYRLWRRWGTGPTIVWIMLNPSTADAQRLDPTVRLCFTLSRAWGYGRLDVLNLFALRATDPDALYRAADPIGLANNQTILDATNEGGRIVCAWGNHGKLFHRDEAVMGILARMGVRAMCLGLTSEGAPRHPLYTPLRSRLQGFTLR